MPASQGWEWDALGAHVLWWVAWLAWAAEGPVTEQEPLAKEAGVFLPVRPKHLSAQALLLCLIGMAASAACFSAPKLVHSIAKQALLGVEYVLPCLFASSISIHLSVPRQFQALPKVGL